MLHATVESVATFTTTAPLVLPLLEVLPQVRVTVLRVLTIGQTTFYLTLKTLQH
jgi:hypothetical protein